jgi:ABC-2 type transport system ATP-binding protein
VNAAALRNVTKRFGSLVALEHVEIELRFGEVLALLGRNGAGKTTALSVLLGLRRPDLGRVELLGRDPTRLEARAAIGVTPQEASFPLTLRVGEIVELVREHFPSPAPVPELLARFRLTDHVRRQAGGLSGGERRRLAVALAFAGQPRAVFLDEPTSGLDPESRRWVWDELAAYASAGGTVLLTTHYLEEAERLASRVVLLAQGKVTADGAPTELRTAARAASFEEAFLTLTRAERCG